MCIHIYKEPGVNKPLKPDDDEKINLNKTKYRNQINKVANAIKEIIAGIGQYIPQQEEASREILTPKFVPWKNRKIKIIAGSIIALALLVLDYFFIPKLNASHSQVEKSIAVLPFINDSPDQENTFFINGLMEEILDNLQKIRDFRVLSRTSTEQFRGTANRTIPEIAKKLDVNYVVEGSGQKYGNNFRLRVQLIAVHNEKHLWAESFEQEIKETKDIFKIQSQIAQSIASELKATITPDERQLIERPQTNNLTAYYYLKKGDDEASKNPGNEAEFKLELNRAEELYKKALQYDSTYALAYVGLADVHEAKAWRDDSYFSKDFMDSVLILADRALSFDDHLAGAYYQRGVYYYNHGKIVEAIKEYDKAIKYNPNLWQAYDNEGNIYMNVYDYMDFYIIVA